MMDGSFLSKCEPSWELGSQVRLFYGTLTVSKCLWMGGYTLMVENVAGT